MRTSINHWNHSKYSLIIVSILISISNFNKLPFLILYQTMTFSGTALKRDCAYGIPHMGEGVSAGAGVRCVMSIYTIPYIFKLEVLSENNNMVFLGSIIGTGCYCIVYGFGYLIYNIIVHQFINDLTKRGTK